MADVTWDTAVEQLTVHEHLQQKESADAKTEKVHMLTTKSRASNVGRSAMRCKRCNKIGHKAAQCRSRWRGSQEISTTDNREISRHRREQKGNILPNVQCFVCGGPHKARECPDKFDGASKRARTVEDGAPQRKFEGKMYMLRTLAPKSSSCDRSKYKIALDSGATTHVVNASSLHGGVEVSHAPTTIRTAHAGDTMTSNLSASVGILKDVIVMEDNNLDMNLASSGGAAGDYEP